MMKHWIAATVLVLAGTLHAQAPEMEWFLGQGTNTEEHVHEGMQTSDGGYIGIGNGIEASSADDMLIIKVNSNGALEWQQQFGTAGRRGTGYCIIETDDGYIAGGAIFDPAVERTQRFLTKLDLDGEVIWERFYSSGGVGGIRGIDAATDGGFILTGYKNAPNFAEFQGFVFIVDEGDGFLLKVDDAGEEEWEQNIDAPQGTKVRQLANGFAVCSTVWEYTPGSGDHQDFCLIETDEDGVTLSRWIYGGGEDEHLYDFDLCSDGGYILGGHTTSYDVVNWDYLLMKIDSEGVEEWHRTFGQPRGYDAEYIHDEAYGVRETSDGGFIICGGSGDEYGYSGSGHPAGPSDEWKAYLVKTNASGTTVWEAVYPPVSEGNNAGEYIGLTEDGGYIVFVDSDSRTPPEPNNFGFMKLAPDPTLEYQETIANKLDFKLHGNYPNPFNPSTVISYSMDTPGGVRLEIFSLQGTSEAAIDLGVRPAGSHSFHWDAGDLPAGIYVYRLISGPHSAARKMLLLP